jgi:solute carrier family 25, member 42
MTGRDLTTVERMQCGAFSGLIAQSITYPIEVTRRRMQTIGIVGTDTALASVGVQEKIVTEQLPSLVGTIRSLYREQGMRGFFKGVSMNWMKGPIAFSISFTAFDTLQGLLESDSEKLLRLPRRFTLRRQE